MRGGDGTAVRTVAALKSALSWAVDQELVAVNPAAKVKLPQSKKRDNRLSIAQVSALGGALMRLEREHPKAVAIIRLLALTGARKGEIEKLRWDEISVATSLRHGALPV